MDEQKLQRLEKLLDLADQDYTTPEDVASALSPVIEAVGTVRQKLEKKIGETEQLVVKETGRIDRRLSTLAKDSSQGLESLRREIRNIELTPGSPGKDADVEEVAARMLSQVKIPEPIPGKDGSPDTAEDIRNKLELLDGDERLDKSAIKGLEEFFAENTKRDDDGITRIIGANKPLWALIDVNLTGLQTGNTIVWDGVQWVPGTGGGGGSVWGSITGTLSDQTDLQAALDTKIDGVGVSGQIPYWFDTNTLGSLSTATYPGMTELSYVKGVTSSIQTQLNAKQATLSLTTTGTSGAATLVGATLNIPQYGSFTLPSLTNGSVLFSNGTTIAQDNANFFWDDTNNRLGIGTATPGATLDLLKNSLGATPSDLSGIIVMNTTPATVGAQQVSPSITLEGQGWKTTATAASQTVRFQQYVLPVQGAANPTGIWKLASSINGGAYTNNLEMTSGGAMTLRSSTSAIVNLTWIGNDARTGTLALNGPLVQFGGVYQATLNTASGGTARFSATNANSVDNYFQLFDEGVVDALGLRRGTNPQSYRVYNTSAASNANYERGVLDWQASANVFQIGTQAGGTGTARSLALITGGTARITIDNTGAVTLSSLTNGLVKSASGVLSNATAGTDYQAPITLTTTGTSGAATFIGNTLNIPNYVAGGGTGDVVGPASAVANNVVFFDGTTGKLIKDSGLALSGSNTGDQTITLTGDITGSGTGSFATAIGAGVVVDADINASAAITLTKLAALTANRAVISNSSGFLTVSAATDTEIGYLSGVTSGIQAQINAKGAGTVTNVSGTTDRITVATGTTTPVIDIAATYVGQTSITTLGTVGTGTWQGTAIADTYISSAATWNAKQSAITFGTGVQTALGVNIGSAGAPVLFNGALGTPSSGTVTNLTGTASININGTVGATTPSTGVFTTLVAGSTTSLLLGTAGSAVGNIGFRNATSGTITLAPTTGALGTVTLTLPAVTDTVQAIAAAQTVTNKRNQPRTASSTTASNLSPDLATANVYFRTTQTATLTIDAPAGTPVIGEVITIYVDSVGAQTLTINSTYKAFGAAFPATTTAGKTFMLTAQFNGTDWKSTWSNAI